MEATWAEREISRVACLIDQIKGKKKIDPSHWDGYHPRVYGQAGSIEAEVLKKELYDEIMKRDRPISSYSLEIQIFFRDYIKEQEKKKKRKQERAIAKLKKKQEEKERKEILARLTDREKKLLRIDKIYND
jgi:hypothetical protein